MWDFLHHFTFGIFPYVALTVFAVGSLIRFDREQYSWRSGSSQLLRKRQLMIGSVLFHVGILLLFVGHFVGLLTPHWVYEGLGVSVPAKQMLAITAGAIFGITCFVGLTILLHRRLLDPRNQFRAHRVGRDEQGQGEGRDHDQGDDGGNADEELLEHRNSLDSASVPQV